MSTCAAVQSNRFIFGWHFQHDVVQYSIWLHNVQRSKKRRRKLQNTVDEARIESNSRDPAHASKNPFVGGIFRRRHSLENIIIILINLPSHFLRSNFFVVMMRYLLASELIQFVFD